MRTAGADVMRAWEQNKGTGPSVARTQTGALAQGAVQQGACSAETGHPWGRLRVKFGYESGASRGGPVLPREQFG